MKLSVVCTLLLACFSVEETQAEKKHGLIILHGLGGGLGPTLCSAMTTGLLINTDEVRVECPEAECRSHSLIPPTWISSLPPSSRICLPSWFDFKLMPGEAVLKAGHHCDRKQLNESSYLVDEIIQNMVDEGIPSENIVVTGPSQGGALTLYHAVHSKFQLGALVPLISWYPNLVSDPPLRFRPVNKKTRILQINGLDDPIVPAVPAGSETRKVMEEVFTNYELKDIPLSSHTINPVTFAKMVEFFKTYDLLSFSSSPLSSLLE